MKHASAGIALSAIAFAFVLAALAADALGDPRVGVTSATTGGPKGKPPAEAERLLHVGVDVQANERITTGASDRAHLLFLDGSSLTVGPQARLTVDRFVYDPNTRSGDLAVNVGQGVLRFVGGRISKSTPVVIATPSSTLTVRGGIALVSVTPASTTAIFVFGNELKMVANGQTQTITRPGWQVTTYAGKAPGAPVQTPPGSLSTDIAQLEALQDHGNAGAVEQAAVRSGFADQNSGRGPRPPETAGGPALLGGVGANAVSNAGTSLQRPNLAPVAPPPPRVPGQ